MKTKKPSSLVVTIFATAAAALFLAGCAEMEAHNTKSLLSAAGFHAKTPQTPQQKEIYDALPAYHVERVSANGKVVYAFKDEKDGVAYVGREPEYQRYKQLCIEQRIAQDYYMASQWNSYYSHRWYGAWGPYGYW
jgi:hypothetical protein